MKRRGGRGSSLASTLVVIAIAVGLAFTLVGLGFHHLNLGNRLSHTQQARNLAEAALSKTMERIFQSDGAFGKALETVRADFPEAPGAYGLVTFDPVTASSEKVQRSTYNLGKETPISAPGGRIVPKQSVHLVGTGRCHGVERRIEAILHIPTFKSALSSESRLVAKGPIVVASAADPDDLQPKPEDHLADLLPAHVSINQSGNLTGPIDITGICQAVGSLVLGGTPIPHARGGMRPNSEAAAIPHLDVNDFDPTNLGKTHWLSLPDAQNDRKAIGLVKEAPGNVLMRNLLLPNGVDKAGAIVFIQGDLEVDSIQGVGAVVATGDITIKNASETTLSTDNAVALLAKGNLKISGAGRNLAYIQGLAYAGKSLTVNKVTIVGALVQAGTNPADELNVEDGNFIHSEEAVGFEFDMPFAAGTGTGFNISLRNTNPLPSFYDAANDCYASGSPLQPAVPVNKSHLCNDLDPSKPVDDPNLLLQSADIMLALNPPYDPIGPEPTLQALFASNPGLYSAGSDRGNTAIFIDQVLIQLAVSNLNSDLCKIELFYRKFPHQPNEKGKIVFDPNRFLSLSQSARVALWKDL